MVEEKITIGELGGYTNNSMNREGLKKLVDKVNEGSSGDAYTKAETDALLADKVDIDDVYTKSEVDTELANKADADDVYTKTETDTLLADKANSDDVYTKTETDALLDDKQNVLTAGTGINITNNVISATGGGGGSTTWTLRTPNDDWSDIIEVDADNTKLVVKKDVMFLKHGDFAPVTFFKGVTSHSGNKVLIICQDTQFYSDATNPAVETDNYRLTHLHITGSSVMKTYKRYYVDNGKITMSSGSGTGLKSDFDIWIRE